MKAYLEIARTPFSRYVGFEIEPQLPFTAINRDLVGDRYGPGNRPVPRDADWAAQVHGGNPDAYFWWMQAATNS